MDILTPVPVAPVQITVESIRKGKRAELLQATAQANGRTVLIARAWRLIAASADFPADFPAQRPPGDARQVGAELTAQDAAFPDGWHRDGYLSAIDRCFERGSGC